MPFRQVRANGARSPFGGAPVLLILRRNRQPDLGRADKAGAQCQLCASDRAGARDGGKIVTGRKISRASRRSSRTYRGMPAISVAKELVPRILGLTWRTQAISVKTVAELNRPL